MLIRGKAPLRVSFAGGGSDVSPYCDKYGGCVLSTTIGMYAYGALEVRSDQQVHICSLDYNQTLKYELGSEINPGDNLAFLQSVIERLKPPSGLNLYLHCDAPPGTGLGSSGTISALIIGLLNNAFNMKMTKGDMAQVAYEIEHDDLGRAVGRQDHYAAVYGGMNFIEFGKETSVVYPIRVEPWILEELGYQLQMFYTQKKRDSSDIVANQIKFYEQERKETLEALAKMKGLAQEMQECLIQGQLHRFGELLHEGWLAKKRMNPGTVNPFLEDLYTTALANGAIGGKITGAGGGGFFVFFTPFIQKKAVADALNAKGAQPVPFLLDFKGLQTWEVADQSLGDVGEGIFDH